VEGLEGLWQTLAVQRMRADGDGGQDQGDGRAVEGGQASEDLLTDLRQSRLIRGAGQQEEMSASAVQQVGEGQTEPVPDERGCRLAEPLQVERAAPQPPGGALLGRLIQEALDAGDVSLRKKSTGGASADAAGPAHRAQGGLRDHSVGRGLRPSLENRRRSSGRGLDGGRIGPAEADWSL